MTLPQGTYNIVIEVGDRISGSIGTFRTERLLTVSESSLDMSDLLLAQKIELVNPFPEKRTDLRIAPIRSARIAPGNWHLYIWKFTI